MSTTNAGIRSGGTALARSPAGRRSSLDGAGARSRIAAGSTSGVPFAAPPQPAAQVMMRMAHFVAD